MVNISHSESLTASLINLTCDNVTLCLQDEDTEQTESVLRWVVEAAISVLVLLGFVGNFISICVLSSSRMKSPNSVILTFLAFFDILILVRSLLFVTVSSIVGESSDGIDLYNIPVNIVYRPFEHIAYFGSLYTTMLLTSERFIVVMFPLRALSWVTVKRARISGLFVLVSSVVYSIPKFFTGSFRVDQDPETNLTRLFVTKPQFSDAMKFFFAEVYQKYLEVIVLLVVPVFALVVLNACIVYKLCSKLRKLKTKQSSTSERRSAVTDRITATTLAIVFTFCITVTLLISDRSLCFDKFGDEEKSPVFCFHLHLASDFMYTFNSAVNFLYYCLFGAKFRNVLISCFVCRVTKTSDTLSTSAQEPKRY